GWAGGIEQLPPAAFGLARVESAPDTPPSEGVRARLDAIAIGCARLRRGVATRQPVEPPGESLGPGLDRTLAAPGDALFLPTLIELERVLDSLPRATGFLDRDRSPVVLPASGALLDSPTGPFF